ncbi:hypothetical protein AVEN_42252-1 [Araneus ventricosus]|uniref:Tc1-like transposase DDE domain-containing protein n=1 Tax=Araneus ventricosus TaxID=182803 RepID=A0A4Y2AYR2_ARAVE|nr:hypothetical protein AVEN_42252-1 [Araneus ventricosus]
MFLWICLLAFVVSSFCHEANESPLNKALESLQRALQYMNGTVSALNLDAVFCIRRLGGKVNKHNCRIWGSENPQDYRELERDSPNVNVWCALSHTEVIGPFFFAETTINSVTYLDMLEMYAVPQMQQHQPDVIFQQDGAPPHWGMIVRDFLDENLPDRWCGRGGLIPWPPRSPDITPLDFFLWGFVKNIVYKTPVPSLDELKRRIVTAIQNVTPQMLENTWREIEFRLDVLRATKGSHVQIH